MRRALRKILSVSRRLIDGPPPSRPFDEFPNAKGLKVLLVEDDEPDAYLIEQALSGNPKVGEILRAEDGVKALELVDKGWFSPDLAIIDLRMPRKDGLTLLKDFAAMERGGFLKVVLTSSAAGSDIRNAFHGGAVEFITKPASRKKLTAELDRVVAGVA